MTTTTTVLSLLVIGALIALSYKRSTLTTAAATMAVITVISLIAGAAGAVTVIALLFAAAFGVLSMAGFRAKTVTAPIFNLYKKIMPRMSETEKTALDAGTVWWDGQLFSGKPEWSMLLNHPNPQIPAEEQAFLDNQVATLCSMVSEWEISQDGDLSKEVWDYIKKERFFSMIIPKSYGGLGFSAQTQSAVLQALSVSGATFSTVGVPNSLGPGELLLKYGTQEQKDHYLPRLADGRETESVQRSPDRRKT